MRGKMLLAGTAGVAPYILKNGTWRELTGFSVDPATCTVSVTVPKDPIVAIMQSTSSQNTTTTVPSATAAGSAGNYKLAGTLIVVMAVMAAIALYLRHRAHKGQRPSYYIPQPPQPTMGDGKA